MNRGIGSVNNLLIAATALSGFLALTSVANAADPIVDDPGHNWYVSVFGGYTFADDYNFDFINAGGVDFPYSVSFDDGFVIGSAVGMVFNENIRFEVEVAHSVNDFGDDYVSDDGGFVALDERGNVGITTVLANVWLNANMDFVQPYIGGGVGIGIVDGDLSHSNGSLDSLDGSDVGFAAQAGAGLRFPASDSFEIDLSYRLRAVFDAEIDSAISGFSASSEDFYTHTVQAGVNILF